MKVKLSQLYYESAPLVDWAKRESKNIRFSFLLNKILDTIKKEVDKIQEAINKLGNDVKSGTITIENANAAVAELLNTEIEVPLTPLLASTIESSGIAVSSQELKLLQWLIIVDVEL